MKLQWTMAKHLQIDLEENVKFYYLIEVHKHS